MNDVVQIQLPLKPEFLPVLQGAVGVIAGTNDFGYDEIMQLRAAVSEVFELGISQLMPQPEGLGINELSIDFNILTEGLEILITPSEDCPRSLDCSEDEETQAVLNSLMDEVEHNSNKAAVRMVKYRSMP